MKVLFIFGTRPEAIKLAPLVKKMTGDPFFEVKVCVTAQHRQMLDQVLDFFDIKPDYDLNIMKPDQTLFDVTCDSLRGIEKVLSDYKADLIIVQGDTTTVLTGALAGYYKKIKVAHVEAGLRSGDKYSPFPEELNRALTGVIADYHFAPTRKASDNLDAEGRSKNVWITGNTVIDALYMGLDIIKGQSEYIYLKCFDFLDFTKKIILVTGHRRESFGRPFENICHALVELAEKYAREIQIVYPVHLNPNIRNTVNAMLKGYSNIFLVEPLEYQFIIWLMNRAHIILTDSGGIQEEGPALGKPVLVMRDVTERPEGISAGTARLTGTDRQVIFNEAARLIDDAEAYEAMAHAVNPYGDGTACDQIINIIKGF